MADFFYWNKAKTKDGFSMLSVYLKNPANNRPGWYFAFPSSYPITSADRSGSKYRRMPVRFGIHHKEAAKDEAHKPVKMGKPGDYLVQGSGGLQIVTEHEYSLVFIGKSSHLPGQKIAESSITIKTGATGVSTSIPTSPTSMGGGY